MMGPYWKRVGLIALAVAGVGSSARHARAEPGSAAAAAPAYTLTVDADGDAISFEALAGGLARELGSPVARADGPVPTRAAIVVRYRTAERTLTVRASHAEGRVLERTVEVDDDAAATRATAVLLAGNLARDEARELLDALAARRTKSAEVTRGATPATEPARPPAAPKRDDGWIPVNLALAWPIATNYGRPDVRTNVDFSLLYGRVGSVKGLVVATGVSHASGDVVGLQFGAVGNGVGGRMMGISLTGGVGVAVGGVQGAQVAGVTNLALTDLRGAQIAAGLNFARGASYGVQLAPVNVAGDLHGAQLAGGVNVARDVSGLQLGVVNVGRRVRGAQLAVINVADEVDGAQVGLLSISRHGIHPVVWGSSLNYVNVGLRFSTKYLYTTSAFSLGTHEGSFASPGLTLGLGTHLPLVKKLDLDVETALSTMFGYEGRSSGTQNSAIHARSMIGWSFAPRLRVFAGGGVRFATAFDVGSPKARPEILAGVAF